MRALLPGHGASRGSALGRARVRLPHVLDVAEQLIRADQIDDEVARLHEAVDATRREMHSLRARLHGALAQEVGEFLDLHALLLDDPELLHGLDELIRTGREEVLVENVEEGRSLFSYIFSVPVLAVATAFFCFNYVLYFFLTWLPSYLMDYQHLDIKSMSIIGVIPWLGAAVGFLGGGFRSGFGLGDQGLEHLHAVTASSTWAVTRNAAFTADAPAMRPNTAPTSS